MHAASQKTFSCRFSSIMPISAFVSDRYCALVSNPASIPCRMHLRINDAARAILSSTSSSCLRIPPSSTSRYSMTFCVITESKVFTISPPVLALAFQLIVFIGSLVVYSRIPRNVKGSSYKCLEHCMIPSIRSQTVIVSDTFTCAG